MKERVIQEDGVDTGTPLPRPYDGDDVKQEDFDA